MAKSLVDFIKGKKSDKPRWPSNRSADEVYDGHVDAIFHHIKQIKELTHKDSLLHRAAGKLGEDSSKYHDIHGHMLNILKKHGTDR